MELTSQLVHVINQAADVVSESFDRPDRRGSILGTLQYSHTERKGTAVSTPSVVACPHCGGQIADDPSLSGQQVACPHCKRPLVMPGQVAAKLAMSLQWYYSRAGQRQGPVATVKLKELASQGQVAPTDLVWKEGMSQWAEARTVKGLFPAPASSQSAPPIPEAPNIPPIPTAVGAELPSFAQPTVAPALWNPFAARAWTLLFSPIFGAFLHARNWKALGEMGRAKRSMIWVYAFIGLVVVALFTPEAVSPVIRLIGLGGILAWCLMDAEQQVRYVKKRFGKDYPRKSWGKPVAIAVCGWVGLIVLAGIIVTASGGGGLGEHPNVTFVKEGHLAANPNVPVADSQSDVR